MVLNPAIVKDAQTNTLHMLFRATGPGTDKKMEGSPYDPYPIYLGYAKSDDMGQTWEADFSRPALAPKVAYSLDEMYIKDDEGKSVVNYANGCIEDPRIFLVEGEWYLSAACRLFPPGPYWLEGKDIGLTHTNVPKWAKKRDNPLGEAAFKNITVTVLFKLDLTKLSERDYDNAFQYICNLTNGSEGDNRDVFLFPNKMRVNGYTGR
jgi:hypothetical protein